MEGLPRWTVVPNIPPWDGTKRVRQLSTSDGYFTLLLIGPPDETPVPEAEVRQFARWLYETGRAMDRLLEKK